MNTPWLHWLLGPELTWLALYVLIRYLAKQNATPPHRMDKRFEYLYFTVPMYALFTFGWWFVPFVVKNGLLLRIWITCMVGGHKVLDTGLSAYSKQGPGIGSAYLAGWLFLFFVLVAGSIIVKIWF